MLKLIFITCALFVINEFGLAQIRIPLIRQKTPREAALNAPNLEKHGVHVDWLKQKNKPDRTNDTIPLIRFLDTEFYGYVVIAHKTYKMVFDTTWSTPWLLSTDCHRLSVGCWFHNKYNHRTSANYTKNGTTFNANEGSYNLTGYYSMDSFTVGQSRVNNQSFVEMTSVPYFYIFQKADGLIGLGFSMGDVNPFFFNLLNQTAIKNPVFSVFINRDRQSKKGGGITLGAIDLKHIHVTNEVPDEIVYLNVDPSNGQWEFHMDRIELNTGKSSYPFCADGCAAIPDTSSMNIIGPQKDIDAIHKLMGAKYLIFGRYDVACDTINKLPEIGFVLNGKSFILKGPDYIQKLSWASVSFCVSSFVASSAPSEQSYWILGGAFLAEYYSIYDAGNMQIGFVEAA